jgi:hypothetical protein
MFKHKFQVAITDGEYWLKGTDVHGLAVTKGHEIDFCGEALCARPLSEGIGRYRWQIDGKTLYLRSIEKDPCPDRSGTLNGATLRSSRHAAAGEL